MALQPASFFSGACGVLCVYCGSVLVSLIIRETLFSSGLMMQGT